MPRALLLRRALWGGVLLGLLFYLALTLWIALSGIFFPYQLDYGEGDVLWFAHELALGHSIYKGMEGLPYVSSNYPPLAMALAVPFQWIFGVSSSIGGRWLNFAAALVAAAFIFRIAKTEIKSLALDHADFFAGVAALAFLGSTFVYHWIPLFRIDLIGLALTAAGLFSVWKWEREAQRGAERPGWLVLAVIFYICALYAKHSLLFAPLASALALFLRNRRTGIAFALGIGLGGGIIFIALDLWTGGGFAFGMLTANATLWLWDTFLTLTRDFLTTYLALILLAICGWWVLFRVRRFGVLPLYAVAALASLALAGRVGAWQNYYFEAIFVACILSALALGWLYQHVPTARWWLPLLLLWQLWLFWYDHDPAIARELMTTARAGYQEVAPLVRAAQGTVISEDMGLLYTNGKPVEYYTFEYSSLARAGLWDQHWELENLRAGQFPLVILLQGTREDVDRFRNFTRDFMSALDYGYALSLEDARYHVYTPAPLAHLQAASFDGQVGLVGWSLQPGEALVPGQTLTVTCVWRAERKLNTEYTAFVHLEDANGGVVAQDDHAPRVGLIPYPQPYPTTHWGSGEMVRDRYVLRLPKDLAPGVYSLRVGWYDSVTQDRLTVQENQDFVELTKLATK